MYGYAAQQGAFAALHNILSLMSCLSLRQSPKRLSPSPFSGQSGVRVVTNNLNDMFRFALSDVLFKWITVPSVSRPIMGCVTVDGSTPPSQSDGLGPVISETKNIEQEEAKANNIWRCLL